MHTDQLIDDPEPGRRFERKGQTPPEQLGAPAVGHEAELVRVGEEDLEALAMDNEGGHNWRELKEYTE